MMEHFNIDAANPVVCLTQANPAHKFMKHDVKLAWQKTAKQEEVPLAGTHVMCSTLI